MKNVTLLLSLPLLLLLGACQPQTNWQPLFNGENLNNWETHIGTPIEGYEALGESATADKVFSVSRVEDENVIRISGEVNGSLATEESFENYHLHMEMKWGEQVYGKRNSGLLYHSYGSFGLALDTWMNSHELQLWTGNMGDSYRMGDTYCEIPVKETGESRYRFDPSASQEPFGKNGISKIARKLKDAEKPVGEWNEIDLYCYGRQSVHVINGETVMVNFNSGKYDNGGITPLTSGKIQIQSEGGEMFLRNIKIRSINQIPQQVLPND